MKTPVYTDMELYVKYAYVNKERVGKSIKILHKSSEHVGIGHVVDLYYFKRELVTAYLTIVYGKEVPDQVEYYFDKRRRELRNDIEYVQANDMLPEILKDQTIDDAFSWNDVYLETFKKSAEKGSNVYILTVGEWRDDNYVQLWNNAYQTYKAAENAFYKWRKEFILEKDCNEFDYSIEQLEVL